MKKLLKTLLLIAALIGFAACDPEGPTKPVLSDEGSSNQELRPRARLDSGQPQPNSFVSPADIKAFIERDCPVTKGAQPSQTSVVPYVDEQGLDTLMYIVNYPGNAGWKVLSADSRTPAIIAEGYSGSFSLDDADGAVGAWMRHIAHDMSRVRRSQDDELTFSDIEIEYNKAFWSGEHPQPRGHGEPIIDPEPQGHWEESIIDIEYERVDSIGHMTPQWIQGIPYNEFTPQLSSSDTTHAPAGCVAVAGAEVLYYLHKKNGIPTEMVSEGYCNGVVGNFSSEFYTYVSSVWNGMSETLRDTTIYLGIPEALMIGHIGKLVSMNYVYFPLLFDHPFSWAYPANLRTEVFSIYGYSSSFGDYDESIVSSSLLNLMPVIITASDQIIPTNGHFHTFVADAYLRTRTKYTILHYWVSDSTLPDPGSGSIIVEPDPYITYSYSSTSISKMKINWGWKSQWIYGTNNAWYSLTSGWTVNNGSYDYNHNISMIYGFTLSN